MTEYEFSEPAYDMLRKRNIEESWVKLAVEDFGIKGFLFAAAEVLAAGG